MPNASNAAFWCCRAALVLVFVTLCAAVYNWSLAPLSRESYGAPLPPLVKSILQTMAGPFTCTALLSIGHASYGKIAGLRGRSLRLPLTLCLLKAPDPEPHPDPDPTAVIPDTIIIIIPIPTPMP